MSHVRDPEHEFGEPGKLAGADDLSLSEKVDILVSWQADLIELQRAEEENMPGSDPDTGAIGKKLSDVTAVLETLRLQLAASDEPGPPAELVREPQRKPQGPSVTGAGTDVSEKHQSKE